MKQFANSFVKRICFLTGILIFIYQGTGNAQQEPLFIPKHLQKNVIKEITITSDMIAKNYYYGITYVLGVNVPVQVALYPKFKPIPVVQYSQKDMLKRGLNKYFVMGSWENIGKAGKYFLSFSVSNKRLPAQNVVRTIRISSNTKEAIRDSKTLIVNGSVGVAPRKGSSKFEIKYELNESSNMTHKIMIEKSNKKIWEKNINSVAQGTRGFKWGNNKYNNNRWLYAEIEAKAINDSSKWDKDISEPFMAIKR